MMFVRVARTPEKINTLAHQIGRSIHFFVIREIKEDEELLVWFSREYSSGVGKYRLWSRSCGSLGNTAVEWVNID